MEAQRELEKRNKEAKYWSNKTKQKRQKKKENIRYWIPHIISILALASSIIGWFLPTK